MSSKFENNYFWHYFPIREPRFAELLPCLVVKSFLEMKLIGAILLYCVCLPLLARCAIETDKFSRIELSVLSPLNNSIVGSFVEVRFQLDFFNEANLRVNPPFTEYVLEIVENNDFAHASIMPNFSPWVSIAYGPIGGEGTRQLDFKMTVNSKHPDALPREYVLRASVTVNAAAKGYLQMSQLSNAELENDNQILNDLLTSLISYHKPLATTVALALDNRNIAYQSVVKVSPQIMEFFDWSAFTADCASSPELNFGPLFTSWQNVHKGSELQYRAYYDVSLVSFTTSIRGLDTTQLNAMTRFLYSMKIRTSGHFVSVLFVNFKDVFTLFAGPCYHFFAVAVTANQCRVSVWECRLPHRKY